MIFGIFPLKASLLSNAILVTFRRAPGRAGSGEEEAESHHRKRSKQGQLKEIEDPRTGRIDRVAGLGASSLSDPSRRDGHFERIRHGTVFL